MHLEQLSTRLRDAYRAIIGRLLVQNTVQPPAEAEHIGTQDEFLAAKEAAGFSSGHHGTYWTPDKGFYLYTKLCHQAANGQQAIEALAFLRFATAKGVLYPGTVWNAYQAGDGLYQLFAVTPRLVNDWDNRRAPDPSRQQLTPTSSLTLEGVFDENSHITEWMRRLDPNYDPSRQNPNSLTRLLNWCEAAHPDNWGWDQNGTLYPIDVETVETSGSQGQADLVHNWYVQQCQSR